MTLPKLIVQHYPSLGHTKKNVWQRTVATIESLGATHDPLLYIRSRELLLQNSEGIQA